MDFLQRVEAEVSLTSRSLNLNHYLFPLTDRESGVSGDQRLASEGHRRLGVGGHEEDDGKIVDDWVGTVELAGTVTVSPLSARIAQCRVVTREDPMEINVPRNQVVMVDPECLPGIHVARVVATLEVYDKQSSFTDARGCNPLVGKPHWWSLPKKTMSPVAMVLKPVRVKTIHRCQRVDCGAQSLSQEVTYSECTVLLPLRTSSVPKMTQSKII